MVNSTYDETSPLLEAFLKKQAEVEQQQTLQIAHLQQCFEEQGRNLKKACVSIAVLRTREEDRSKKLDSLEVKIELLVTKVGDLAETQGRIKTAVDIKTGIFGLIGGAIPASAIIGWMLLKG